MRVLTGIFAEWLQSVRTAPVWIDLCHSAQQKTSTWSFPRPKPIVMQNVQWRHNSNHSKLWTTGITTPGAGLYHFRFQTLNIFASWSLLHTASNLSERKNCSSIRRYTLQWGGSCLKAKQYVVQWNTKETRLNNTIPFSDGYRKSAS